MGSAAESEVVLVVAHLLAAWGLKGPGAAVAALEDRSPLDPSPKCWRAELRGSCGPATEADYERLFLQAM
jgi:hypothetical protein